MNGWIKLCYGFGLHRKIQETTWRKDKERLQPRKARALATQHHFLRKYCAKKPSKKWGFFI
jgi:hypothetical protein